MYINSILCPPSSYFLSPTTEKHENDPAVHHYDVVMITLGEPLLFVISASLLVLLLARTSLLRILLARARSLLDRCHVYASYRVPQVSGDHHQPNLLYAQIRTYLDSIENDTASSSTLLLSGPAQNDIVLKPDPTRPIHDSFLGARFSWAHTETTPPSLVLTLRKEDQKRILKPYLEKILSAAQEHKDLFYNFNSCGGDDRSSAWVQVPFHHPATMDTLVMDPDLKAKVKSDLESFLKSKQQYHRVGRVWKRSYLLHGGPGTGKSTFVAAAANFLHFDVYDLDLSCVRDDADLKTLLLKTTRRSIVVVEGLDRYVSEPAGGSGVSLPGLMSFMDGIGASCGEERLVFFTVTSLRKADSLLEEMDPAVTRSGRIDVRIEFPTCDNFPAFKTFASSYLGLKEHKLFPQIEEIFNTGASISPAEIGEIMMSNRSSPSRALKTVMTALGRRNSCRRSASGGGEEEVTGGSGGGGGVYCRESVHMVTEFRKLYGLLRVGSRRRKSEDMDMAAAAGTLDKSSSGKSKDGSRH